MASNIDILLEFLRLGEGEAPVWRRGRRRVTASSLGRYFMVSLSQIFCS